jgi:hypothetical protein
MHSVVSTPMYFLWSSRQACIPRLIERMRLIISLQDAQVIQGMPSVGVSPDEKMK